MAVEAGVVPKPPPSVNGFAAVDGVLKLKAGAAAALDVVAPNPPKLNAGAALVVAGAPNPPKVGATVAVAVEPNPPNAGGAAEVVAGAPKAGAAVGAAPKPPNPPVEAAVEACVPKEKGVAAAVGADEVAAPNENPDDCVAGVAPNPKLVVEAAGAPNPPIGVVVNPGVVRENAGAAEAALGCGVPNENVISYFDFWWIF